MVVFDDVFVDQNVYSGLAVAPVHRQNLHELILGVQAVALNQQLQRAVARIEVHNSELRNKAAAIPATERGTLSVDDFCALPARTDIDVAIQATERNLAAAREQDPVRSTSLFDTLRLPAFDVAAAALAAKQTAPLERIALAPEARAAVTVYEAHRLTIAALNDALQQANTAIRVVKEQAAAGTPAAIAADLSRLKAVKARHTPTIAVLCNDYLTEKAAKAQTEQQRDQARTALDQYRTNVFPGYETAVNLYLQRFNAGFRLHSVTFENTRGGPACSYNVMINNTPVPIAGGTPSPGEQSFRNTLSSGDRNTLALAFFFASLDQNPGLASEVVVIDDPISSLDDHRSLTTVQEVRRLAERAGQVIVLSHNKPFLCRIWEGADRTTRTALEVARDGTGSTLREWDVNQDCITKHDRRHAMLRDYLTTSKANNREVARAIRPVLEAFCRVAYPEHFGPGALLGPLLNVCRQRLGTPQEILSDHRTQELEHLLEYANRFHHDTNAAWETETVNDAELVNFVSRTLGFTGL